MSKVFEKLLRKRLTNFLIKKNVFTPVQFGFRSKHCCVHAISEITDFIRDTIEKKIMDQACFIELKQAFDFLDHSQLLRKRYYCGFRGPLFDIMKNYLSGRWQYVFDKEYFTKKLPVVTGVPK